MAQSFGLFLKSYEGTSSGAREAARHWRGALRNDYVPATDYRTVDDVKRRLAQRGRLHVKVLQGVDIAWLAFRSQKRAKAEASNS